jgi:hypothetical protein
VPPKPGLSARAGGRGCGARNRQKDRVGVHQARNSQISLGFVKAESRLVRWVERWQRIR